MRKFISLFFVASFMALPALSQTEDDHIIIADRNATYEYRIEKGNVVIKEAYEATYEALTADRISVYEMYDNESSIDKVKIKGLKGVVPEYRQHRSNNIFYSDAKVCYFQMDFQRSGMTARVEFEKTFKDPRYFVVVPLAAPQYIKRQTVRIVVPEWMKVELVDYNQGSNIKKEVQTGAKETTYVYTVENQEAMADESLMQGISHIYPHVLVMNKHSVANGEKTTYFETLSDLYNWYKHIVNQTNNDKNILAAKAREITKESKTELDKVKDIFAWVQNNIRYVAFEDGIAGFKPDDAQEVLRKKYGDCKGMANLTKELLVAEGFDARLTWLGTSHVAYDYTTPCLAADNHMICTLFYGGETYYLDATYEYMPLGEYPQSIQGQQVMIEDNEKFILNRIPVASPRLNTDSLYCRFTIGSDGLEGEVSRTFMGESKERILSLINATPKDKIDEALKSFAERANLQDKATNLKLEGATPKSEATRISFDLKNKSGIQQLNKELYIDLNRIKDFDNLTIDLKKRRTNLLLDYCYRMLQVVELVIPESHTLTHTPENMRIEREGYLFAITYTQKENRLVYYCELTIKDPLIKKSAFEQWNADIDRLKKNYAEQIVLTVK